MDNAPNFSELLSALFPELDAERAEIEARLTELMYAPHASLPSNRSTENGTHASMLFHERTSTT